MNRESGPEHSARSSLVINDVLPLPHSPCKAMVRGAEEFSINFIKPLTYRSVPKSLTFSMKGKSDNEVLFMCTLFGYKNNHLRPPVDVID